MAYSNLDHALGEKGQLDEAFAAYRQILMQTPENPDALQGAVILSEGQSSHPLR
jgi:hypothetical protein